MGTAVVGAGEEAQLLHVDDGVYAFPRPHPNLVCNTMWALDDFTAENGATRVVPESHTWDRDPSMKQSYDTVPLVMPRGSIAFVVGSLYHGAGHNMTSETRHALTINYCNGSMRQQENLMLGVHAERLMTFPKPLQDILGLKQCKGAGHIFASNPRGELTRRYGAGNANDPFLERRDELHAERLNERRK